MAKGSQQPKKPKATPAPPQRPKAPPAPASAPKEPKEKKAPKVNGGPKATGDIGKADVTTSDYNAQARAEAAEQFAKVAADHHWPPWAPSYLVELVANCGQKVGALKVAGRTFGALYSLRTSNTAFAAAELDAMSMAQEVAESEARRRAVSGVMTMRTIMPDGRLIEKIEYSDTILLRLLERLETGSWRQKQQVEHSAPGIFGTRAERKAALAKARADQAADMTTAVGGGLKLIAGQGGNGTVGDGSTEGR